MIRTEDRGRVRIVTLDRPEARNALDAALRGHLVEALQRAGDDAGVGAVVLTGAGKCFAAGADLRELSARSSAEQSEFLQPPHIYSAVEDLPVPVVCVLNGHALGAGLELATACDYRVAHPKAKLGQPEIHMALMPGGGGTQRLVRIVGRSQAARLVLTGDAVDAQEALRIGLVDEVAEDCLGAGMAVAEAMARHDRQAVQAARASLHDAWVLDYERGLGAEIDRFVQLHGRDEARRRIQAFLER